MSEAAVLEPEAVPKVREPKVLAAHPWLGRMVHYWRVVNEFTGEIGPLPAMLIAPTRAAEGCWDLNFWRLNHMQGRQRVRLSETPKAGCFTLIASAAKLK